MGKQRQIHTGTAGRIALDELAQNHGSGRLISLSSATHAFEQMTNYSMQCWYLHQPDGYTNYTNPKTPSELPLHLREDIGVGEVQLTRENQSLQGKIIVNYYPSAFYHKKFGYLQKHIAVIDLSKQAFRTMWDGAPTNQDLWRIPNIIMVDTEVVLPLLGLRKKE